MKREVSTALFAVLIIAAAFLAVYYFGITGPTGFAVFNQNSQTSFDEGTYSNVLYDSNASAVVLAVNQTSGSYTSKVLDAGASTTWNNLTFSGNGVTFEVKVCTAADCSDANFSAVGDLNNLNLTGQYFQYQAVFDSVNDSLTGVIVDYNTAQQQQQPVAPTVSVSQPEGQEHHSLADIPLVFTITQTGTNLTCIYDVNYAGGTLVANTSISCVNGTNTAAFDLPSKGGDNVLTLYVADSYGSALASSPVFQISLSNNNNNNSDNQQTQEQPVINETQTPTVTAISVGAVASQDIVQGDSKELSLSVQNTGATDVTSCTLTGDDSGLVTVTSGATNIAAGASAGFNFKVAVPEETAVGTQTLALSVGCAETSGSTSFAVNVLQKKLDFNITNVQRTRQDRVSVDYTITELAGEDQDLQIYFSIKDASGTEVANASQNRSIDANKTDDFRTNVPINESLNGTMTLSAAFNSQIFSSTVLEPIDLSTVTGGAIFGGVGAGSIVVVVMVVVVLGAIFFVARKLRKTRAAQ